MGLIGAVVMHQERASIAVVLVHAVGHQKHVVAVLVVQHCNPAVGRHCGRGTEAVGF